ncbi:MAG: TRAP transporter small permease [Desulfobacterales bacterium]|jgi:TRAP-type C4-dicarboxylate transport system permease small subunit
MPGASCGREDSLILRIEQWVTKAAEAFNWVSAAAVVGMMVLTCMDIILRLFRHPIPGTYEMVGFLGAVFAAFSLGYTSVKRGHIAVDFLVQKLPQRVQSLVDGINALICAIFFALVARQCMTYAADLKNYGEVSMTLQMPVYPFVYGIAAGCVLLTLVLVVRFIKDLAVATGQP